jgi:hypothetical protein
MNSIVQKMYRAGIGISYIHTYGLSTNLRSYILRTSVQEKKYVCRNRYTKNVQSRNWYILHTYVRTQYKSKIVHT